MFALILTAAIACSPDAAVAAPEALDVAPSWVVDSPLGGILAPSTTSGVRGVLSPSLRVTFLQRPQDRFRLGFEGAIFGTYEDDGTDRIQATAWTVGAEAGGLMGWAYGSQKARFMPYLWGSGLAAAGAATRRVDTTVEGRPLILGGVLAGIGAQIQVFWFSLRVDLGLGVLGAETTGRARAAVGAAF